MCKEEVVAYSGIRQKRLSYTAKTIRIVSGLAKV
jgi:hypothetical protein